MKIILTLAILIAFLAEPCGSKSLEGKEIRGPFQFFSEWYQLKPTPDGAQDEFNYIEKFAWFYYENEFGQKIVGEDPGLNWTEQFVEARRKFLLSQQSTETIAQWMADPSIHMEQYIIPADGFKSFNQFFIRDLKPGMRTIASPWMTQCWSRRQIAC